MCRFPTPHPTLLLRDSAAEDELKTDDRVGDGAEPVPERIVCRLCAHHITDFDHRCTVSGRHEHDFANPTGYLFHVGCFSTASGCVFAGVPTREHTWFTGFAWNYAHCGRCGSHLGWRFTEGPGESFVALIVSRIVAGQPT